MVGSDVSGKQGSVRGDAGLRLVLLAVSIGVVATALGSMAPEFSAFDRANETGVTLLQNPAVELDRQARAVEGVYSSLTACDRALSDLFGYFEPPESRQRAATQCRALAEAVLERSPTLSLAHQVLALSALEFGDRSAVEQALVRAEASGGVLLWMAQRRAGAAFSLSLPWSPGLAAAIDRDIGRLVVLPAGADWLAQQYERHPNLRPIIEAAIEAQPEERQSAFVAAVRRMARN